MPAVVAFVDDLMFLSRIREAAGPQGVEVRSARKVADLVQACHDAPRAVFVDLDSARLPTMEALAALKAEPPLAAIPVIGFFSHVHPDRARAAMANGCARVLARSAFVRELPGLLAVAD